MLRSLDKNWWTSFGFFVATVAICTGALLYKTSVDERRYSEIFQMMVTPTTSQSPSVGGMPMKPIRRQTAIDI